MISFESYKNKEFKQTFKTTRAAGTLKGVIIWADNSASLYQDKREFERDRSTPMAAKVFS